MCRLDAKPTQFPGQHPSALKLALPSGFTLPFPTGQYRYPAALPFSPVTHGPHPSHPLTPHPNHYILGISHFGMYLDCPIPAYQGPLLSDHLLAPPSSCPPGLDQALPSGQADRNCQSPRS